MIMLFHPISLMLILRQVFSTVLWDVTRLCMWLHDACKDSGHIYTVTCVCKGIYTFHMYIYIYTCVCMCVYACIYIYKCMHSTLCPTTPVRMGSYSFALYVCV